MLISTIRFHITGTEAAFPTSGIGHLQMGTVAQGTDLAPVLDADLAKPRANGATTTSTVLGCAHPTCAIAIRTTQHADVRLDQSLVSATMYVSR